MKLLVITQAVDKKNSTLGFFHGWLSELAGSTCETFFPLFGTKPPLTWQIAWLSQRQIFFSSDKAIAELGLKQTSFEDTIRRTAPYYLNGTTRQSQ